VIVTYNNADEIAACLEPLAGLAGLRTIVVDNASTDGTRRILSDLHVETIELERNMGFAAGVNVGWRMSSAPYVLLLNPDARIEPDALGLLVRILDTREDAGAVGPRIVEADGRLAFSQRRFPRLRSTYARALFLHRVFPRSAWSDELVRDDVAYRESQEPEWISGACLLVRRSDLEAMDGLDETFFMYSEDTDLCKRLWRSGRRVLFAPEAVVHHAGGRSAPRAALLTMLAASRLTYARKHHSPLVATLHRVGIALVAGSRVVLTNADAAYRRGQARAFWYVCTGR
jgi:GT2 family glycosyltransferase